jgi:hypothetical protein
MNLNVTINDCDLSLFDILGNIDSTRSGSRNSHKYRKGWTANSTSSISCLIVCTFVAVSIATPTAVNVAQEVKLRHVRI